MDDLREILEWNDLDEQQQQRSGMESDNPSSSSNFSGTSQYQSNFAAPASFSASASHVGGFHYGAHPAAATQSSRSNSVQRFALRMRSEKEIVDDGYRWRKYGKKQVKSNPNPRNYFKCWARNCNVKKQVERDAHDSGIVITTYKGRHNHERPSLFLTMQAGNPMLFADNRNHLVVQNPNAPPPSNQPGNNF